MRIRTAIIALTFVVLIAGIWTLSSCGSGERTQLVPAWQLLDSGRYRGMGLTDPFLSWAPDSRSVIFSVFGLQSQKDTIYKWNVGEKGITAITDGASPVHISESDFLYLRKPQNEKQPPKAVFTRSLVTGKESEVMSAAKNADFWEEVTAFSYDPAQKHVIVRLTEFSDFYTPGSQVFDMNGKHLGQAEDLGSEGVMDSSPNPAGSNTALLIQAEEGKAVALQIAAKKATSGETVASGILTCVAWSPNGEILAYGRMGEVVAMRPSDHRSVVIGRFAKPDDPKDKTYVHRLIWSPSGDYLSVLIYVPDAAGDYPLIYVLDMSKFDWDR